MGGNLFISIYGLSSGAAPRAGRVSSGLGSDPGAEYVAPDPDDPASEYVAPDPDDPGSEYVAPDPDDPGAEYVAPDPDDPGHPAETAKRPAVVKVHAAETAVTPCIPSCACRHGAEGSEGASRGLGREHSGFVIVRLAADVRPLTFPHLYALANELGLHGLKAALEVAVEESEGEPGEPRPSADAGARRSARSEAEPEGVLRSAPLVDVPGLATHCEGAEALRVATVGEIARLEELARRTPLRPLHGLASYWRVDLRPHPERVDEVIAALSRLREVDVAYRELVARDPATSLRDADHSLDQGYLDDAPVGVSARWALSQSGYGVADAVRLVDLEQGWHASHDALPGGLEDLIYGDNRAVLEGVEAGQHGTAVLGQLAASQTLHGAARERAAFALTSHYKGDRPGEPFPRTNGHVAAAIVNALVETPPNPRPLGRGDVLLLEVQRGLFPTEIDPADFDAIRLASALGVIVVEAAGNGNYDLDAVHDPVDGRTFRRGDARFRDSGALFVGAALSALPHDRAPFSNFGSRIDCFAWGEGVTTAGYGDLAGDDPDGYYTNTFSGTSSAAPVIAGAAALVQNLHAAHTGSFLRPQPMRALLSNPATGVRQGPNVGGHIGVMPDLRQVLGLELGLVPHLYLRKSPCDDGGVTLPQDDKSSSPDLVVWATQSPALGDEGPTAHQPTPGEPLRPGGSSWVFVRLRNRGGGQPKPNVHLFASPAATLISPERWSPIPPSQGVAPAVVMGDTLVVSPGVKWEVAPPWPQPAKELLASGWLPPGERPDELHGLLAVIEEEGNAAPVALPPGPPYFQWASFRAFLRQRNVACRNAHRIDVEPGRPVVLACVLAGSPDRARRFDFEIVQRLPEGARVTIAAEPATAAKLRQRQPWLNGDGVQLELPVRRSTRFSRLALPAATYQPLWLRIEPGVGLTWGHSLVVRQLWRGEEVGRMSWYFGRRG